MMMNKTLEILSALSKVSGKGIVAF